MAKSLDELKPTIDRIALYGARKKLDAMFAGRHFDICAVRSAVEAVRVKFPPHIEDGLRPLHCVPWHDIDAEVKAAIHEVVYALIPNGEVTP